MCQCANGARRGEFFLRHCRALRYPPLEGVGGGRFVSCHFIISCLWC